MSCLLFIGTYLIANALKGFKSQRFLPTIIRSYVSDFAVIIAIIIMVIIDLYFAVETPKLNVPREFSPTWEGRGENEFLNIFGATTFFFSRLVDPAPWIQPLVDNSSGPHSCCSGMHSHIHGAVVLRCITLNEKNGI